MKTENKVQSVEVLRDAPALLKLVSFDDNGSPLLKEGANLTVRDMATLGEFQLSALGGARDKTCGLLALAEKQPPVSVAVPAENGGVAIIKAVPALTYVIAEISRSEGVSAALLRECVGLLPKYKIAIANGWKPSAYYDAQSVVMKFGILDATTLRLNAPSETDKEKRAAFDKIKKALDEKVPTSNVLRPLLEKTKEEINAKLPGTFPKRGAKGKVAAAIASTSPTVPAPVVPKLAHDAASVAKSIVDVRTACESFIAQHALAMKEMTMNNAKNLQQCKASFETDENNGHLKVIREIVESMTRIVTKSK